MSDTGKKRRHYQIIRKNYTYLVDILDVKQIMDSLFSQGYLTKDDLEEIKAEDSRRNATKKFLNILSRSGIDVYEPFIESLRTNGYKQVVEKLENLHQ
ncbi:hypothetical protein SNE40_023304 [Patella caerulea]|uniref:CARD domain-containing protein n=1 Tax=Patella caerulea TaxID=87958 RepID=A0AAN8GHW0_PATCE